MSWEEPGRFDDKILIMHTNNQAPTLTPEDYADHGLGPLDSDEDPKQLYLDLLKRVVSNTIYEDEPLFHLDDDGELVASKEFSLEYRVKGRDLPVAAHTMVGIKRLNNLQYCVENTIVSGVAGDIVESGVYRGGASIFARAVLKAHHVVDRRVILCDTFLSGPPLPYWKAFLLEKLASIPSRRWQRWFYRQTQRDRRYKSFPKEENPDDEFTKWSIWSLQNARALQKRKPASLETVKLNFARYGLLDDQVMFLQGFFADTLPRAPINRVSVLRLDGDTYESTIDVLTPMYPKLSRGGFCIIDDYHAYRGCRRAVDEYRQANHIEDAIQEIDGIGVFWQRS